MSASGGTRAVMTALIANAGLAIAKLVAWALSGSSALLAQALHSVAAAGSQLLLLSGARDRDRSDVPTHPLGFRRERFAYGFVAGIVLFTVGGVLSLIEGAGRLRDDRPLEAPWLAVAVLVVALVAQTLVLRTTVRESRAAKATATWSGFVRRATAPELPIVLIQAVAGLIGALLALAGVALAMLTGDAVWDAVASLAVGALLVVVAVVLAIEVTTLLVGVGASTAEVDRIRSIINGHPAVEALIHMDTHRVGPDELFVAAKIALPRQTSLADIAYTINAIEARIREGVPVARVIYLEPDILQAPSSDNPTTDAIVIRAAD